MSNILVLTVTTFYFDRIEGIYNYKKTKLSKSLIFYSNEDIHNYIRNNIDFNMTESLIISPAEVG